jgi:transposase
MEGSAAIVVRSQPPWAATRGEVAPDLERAIISNAGAMMACWSRSTLSPAGQFVTRSDTAKGLGVLPRRWVVERTFAWLGRGRRLAKDWEKSIASAEAWVLIAHIRRMTRLLARG